MDCEAARQEARLGAQTGEGRFDTNGRMGEMGRKMVVTDGLNIFQAFQSPLGGVCYPLPVSSLGAASTALIVTLFFVYISV